ncbi:MAG TPA: DNA internalization-related competence protein ComEC/Rec2 [Bacilli bacterium]|nr:DNA internalization-related competence protein ComEC/Rec2 [Bacilli bacterium]
MRGKGYFLVISLLVGYYLANQLILSFAIALVWLVVLLIYYQRKRLELIECLVLVGLTLFFSQHFILDQFDRLEELGNDVVISGKVTAITKQSDQQTTFILRDSASKQLIQINQFLSSSVPLRVGARCQVTGEMNFPTNATNPGQFDFQSYLADQGIDYQINLNQSNQLQCTGTNLAGRLNHLRDQQMNRLDQRMSETSASWIKSLIFGDRSELDDQVQDLFERWHLTHLLAISGLHVSIIVAILHFICIYLCRLTKETTYQLLITFLLIYPILAGGAPSIWRAALVTICNYLAWYQRDRIISIDFLSLAFVLLLFLKPEWINHLGFQFSFLISFSLLLSKKILIQLKTKFAQMVFISLLCMVMIIPIQVNAFYLFNPISFIINLVVTFYFSSFFIPLIFFGYLVSLLFPPLLVLIEFLIELSNQLFITLIQFVDTYLYYPIVTGKLSPLIITLYYLCLFYLLVQFEKRQFNKVISSFILLIMIIVTNQITPYLSPYGKVTVLDLGQANSLIIELPHRKAVVIYDVGATLANDYTTPTDRAYQQIIKPFLYQAGINKIDAVILSHEDHDHLGSLPYLLEDFTVQTVITSAYFEWPELLLNPLKTGLIEHQRVKAGESFSIGSHDFYSLNPSRDWRNTNDNSLVIETRFADQSWLLTGDISAHVEETIVKNNPQLAIDTLVVAHHGSATSTSQLFLTQIAPNQAIIPVGRNNFFNHPSEIVLNRLTDQGLKIYRTDQDGAIQFIFHKNQRGGTFSTHLP